MVGTADLIARQNSDFTVILTWKDSSNNPINLTGYIAEMQIRPSKDSPQVIATLSTVNGEIILGGAAGTIELFIPGTITANYAPTQAVYDILLRDANNITTCLLEGNFTIQQGVTVWDLT